MRLFVLISTVLFPMGRTVQYVLLTLRLITGVFLVEFCGCIIVIMYSIFSFWDRFSVPQLCDVWRLASSLDKKPGRPELDSSRPCYGASLIYEALAVALQSWYIYDKYIRSFHANPAIYYLL